MYKRLTSKQHSHASGRILYLPSVPTPYHPKTPCLKTIRNVHAMQPKWSQSVRLPIWEKKITKLLFSKLKKKSTSQAKSHYDPFLIFTINNEGYNERKRGRPHHLGHTTVQSTNSMGIPWFVHTYVSQL